MDLTQENIAEARDLIAGAWFTVHQEWAGAVSDESIERDEKFSLAVFDELVKRFAPPPPTGAQK